MFLDFVVDAFDSVVVDFKRTLKILRGIAWKIRVVSGADSVILIFRLYDHITILAPSNRNLVGFHNSDQVLDMMVLAKDSLDG